MVMRWSGGFVVVFVSDVIGRFQGPRHAGEDLQLAGGAFPVGGECRVDGQAAAEVGGDDGGR